MTKSEIQSLIEPDRYTRAWWFARLRGLLWVAVVTLFLWVWADVEFTDEMELTATVRLSTAASSGLVLRSPGRHEVSFTVQGRQRSLDRLQLRLASPETVIRHAVTRGEQNVSMRDILNASDLIVNEGLTVVKASPNYVAVDLDERIFVPDVPVRFDYEGALSPEITIEPMKMGLHVARSDWDEITASGQPPVLSTKRVNLATIPNPSEPFQVELIPRIAGVPVEPNQPSVRVSVKITLLTETQEIAVPVRVLQPPAWLEDSTWKEYTLSRKDRAEWRVTLTVSGPRAHLDRLKPENVHAYITLTDEDRKPVSWLTRQVEVQLPDELKLKLFGTPPTVTFKLERILPVGML